MSIPDPSQMAGWRKGGETEEEEGGAGTGSQTEEEGAGTGPKAAEGEGATIVVK